MAAVTFPNFLLILHLELWLYGRVHIAINIGNFNIGEFSNIKTSPLVRYYKIQVLLTTTLLYCIAQNCHKSLFCGNFFGNQKCTKYIAHDNSSQRDTIKGVALGMIDGSWLHFKMATTTGDRKNVSN